MKKITPKMVADRLGISVQAVRVFLQQGKFPFGAAVRNKSTYQYVIFPKLYEEYIGGSYAQ